MPITACDLLYDRVLPFYAELGVEVSAVIDDDYFCRFDDDYFCRFGPS